MVKETLFATNDRKLVPVKAWGLDLYVRVWTYNELEQLREKAAGHKDDLFFNVSLMVVHGLCTADGALVFTDEDIPRFRDKDPETVAALAQEVYKANGMDADANTKKKLEDDLFLFRLAGHIKKSVAEVKTLDVTEIWGWAEYDRTIGFDVDRLEIAVAINSHLYAQAKFNGKHKVTDFMARFVPPVIDPKIEGAKIKGLFDSMKRKLNGK